MSYVLDALAKSEKQRALRSMRPLEASVAIPSQRRMAKYRPLLVSSAVVTVLLLSAYVARDDLRALWNEHGGPSLQAALLAPFTADATTASVRDMKESRAGDAGAGALRASADPRQAERTATEPQNVSSTTRAPAVSGEVAPDRETARPAGSPAPPQTLPLTLDVLSYSNDVARRFVMINQEIYREGDLLPGEATLVRITPEGPIINQAGHEYLLSP